MNITVNFFSTKYMKHCAGCPSLPAHMKTKFGSLDELPCYNEGIDGLSENEDDTIDEVQFDDNNISTSGSVPDVSDDLVTPDSPQNPNDGDKISEAFEWNKESEAREPPLGNSFASQEQSQLFSSTTPLTMKSSSTTSLQRAEIIEEDDFMSVMNKSDADLSQPEPEQSGATTLVANKNRDVGRTFVVPHETEIIDLSTPSPSCRSVLDRKKRRVSSSVGTDFIDLTNSPNFIEL